MTTLTQSQKDTTNLNNRYSELFFYEHLTKF